MVGARLERAVDRVLSTVRRHGDAGLAHLPDDAGPVRAAGGVERRSAAMSVSDSILITGGGMLATALRDVLEQRGVKPRVLDRMGCDITQEQGVRKLVELLQPKIILN